MPYHPELAERIRAALAHVPGIVERRMFGGLAFLLDGRMAVVASNKGGLMIRIDPAISAELVETTQATYAEMRGRHMRNWLYLDRTAVPSRAELEPWIRRAIDYSAALARNG